MDNSPVIQGMAHHVWTERPVLRPDSCAIDAHGRRHPLSWAIAEDPDGSVRLNATLPETVPIARVKATLTNRIAQSPGARWVRFFGSDLCSVFGISRLDRRSLGKLRELRGDHQWVTSLGTKLPGHASHLVAAIVDAAQPTLADTILFGFLPDNANRSEATFQLMADGSIEVSFWYDNTGVQTFTNDMIVLRGSYSEVIAAYAEGLRAHLDLPQRESSSARVTNLCLWASLAKMVRVNDLQDQIQLISDMGQLPGMNGLLPIDYITADDSVWDTQGDFSCRHFLRGGSFPTFQDLVRWSQRMGVAVELWWSPFEAAEGARTVKQHPDLFVRSGGKPYPLPGQMRSMLYGGKHLLDCLPARICLFDIRKEKVLAYLGQRAEAIVSQFGVTRVKLDFLHWTLHPIFLQHNTGKTRVELARRAIQSLVDGVKRAARAIGREDDVEILLGQAPLTAFLGLNAEKLRVRFSDDALPAPIWRTPIPPWTRVNWLLEKLHHKYPNPCFWWNEATRAIQRAPLLAGVCEPFADSAMLELKRCGVHPNLAKAFVLKTLAPQPWVRTLSIANDLRELSREGLRNVAELLKAMKTDRWQDLPAVGSMPALDQTP